MVMNTQLQYKKATIKLKRLTNSANVTISILSITLIIVANEPGGYKLRREGYMHGPSA